MLQVYSESLICMKMMIRYGSTCRITSLYAGKPMVPYLRSLVMRGFHFGSAGGLADPLTPPQFHILLGPILNFKRRTSTDFYPECPARDQIRDWPVKLELFLFTKQRCDRCVWLSCDSWPGHETPSTDSVVGNKIPLTFRRRRQVLWRHAPSEASGLSG